MWPDEWVGRGVVCGQRKRERVEWMAEGNKKIQFLIKRLCDNLKVNDESEETLNLLLQNLLIQHKEYLRVPRNDLRDTVLKALQIHLKSKTEIKKETSDTGSKTTEIETTPKVTQVKKRKRPQSIDPAADTMNPSKLQDDGFVREQNQNFFTPRPLTRLSNLAGLDNVIKQVREIVFFPVELPELYSHLGISPPSGLLLHGPSGCGKTTLANAIAGELGIPYFKASGPELIGGTSGESEQRIRELFDLATSRAPSILFIDGFDVIAGKRESSQRGMDRRVVAQLFDCIDQIKSHSQHKSIFASPESDSEESSSPPQSRGHVILIAATNRPDSLDPGVRGRFSREISLPVPDASARSEILRLITQKMNLSTDVDFVSLGKATPGYVGSDLYALCSEAGLEAIRRIVLDTIGKTGNSLPLCHRHEAVFQTVLSTNPVTASVSQMSLQNDPIIPSSSSTLTESEIKFEDELEKYEDMLCDSGDREIIEREMTQVPCFYCSLVDKTTLPPIEGLDLSVSVTMADFMKAAKSVQPSAKREGFAVVPDVTWKDVGALSEVREELLHNVLEPIAHPERFLRLGLDVPAGVLFFGPPGCGKTLLAKALANQSGANFISVKGPELLNMYVGESESRVRQVFTRARASAPCVIFFDELDALCPKRGSGGEGGSGVSERVVNQLLTELDGLETRKDVYIIAATNRLELIDDAMLRPGRLGKLLYVPLPSASDRSSILSAICRKVAVNYDDLNFDVIAADPRADGFSGADLAALVREAGLAVLGEWREQRERNPKEVDDASIPFEAISSRHFEKAYQKVRPSVSPEDRVRYELVHRFIREEGLGAIEALKAVRTIMEERAQGRGRVDS